MITKPGVGRSLVVVATIFSAACAGSIEEAPPVEEIAPGEATEPSRPGSSGATGPQTPRAPANPPLVPPERTTTGTCKEVDPGPAFMRRLNRREYDNTIRELLGDTSGLARDFPVEERHLNFDNNAEGLTVSPLLTERYLAAAERLAAAAVERSLSSLLGGCDPTREGEDACAGKFLTDFGKRAYRRPVPPEDAAILNDAYRAGKAVGGFKTGIEVALAAMLQSPRFLYRVETAVPAKPGQTVRLDAWEVASRLSYLLWNSMPDEALFAAAAAGRLATSQDIAAEVRRMLGDPKARAMMSAFYDQWFGLSAIEDLNKDPKIYPSWNPAVAAAMRSEVSRFLEHVVWEGEGTVEAMLTAPYTFSDAALTKYYGLPSPAAAVKGFQKVMLDGQTRGGLLTQGGLMALLADANQTSPIRRGKFVREALLCMHLPPPPDDAMVQLPKLDPKLTTRQRFSQHSSDPACAGCHRLMDPIGLGFESFDGVGLLRTSENGVAIHASGEIVGFEGDGRFVGPVDLGRKLAGSEVVRQCLVRNLFRFGLGRGELQGTDDCSLDLMRRRFDESGLKIRALVAALTETDAFLYRKGGEP